MGAVVVYDVTNEKSFESLSWHIENLKEHAEKNIVIMIIGNKIDLLEEGATRVDQDRALAFARENHCLYEETSAKTNQNVKEAFEKLVDGIKDVLIFLFFLFF